MNIYIGNLSFDTTEEQLRQAFEGVAGATLVNNELVLPNDMDKPRGDLRIIEVRRDTEN